MTSVVVPVAIVVVRLWLWFHRGRSRGCCCLRDCYSCRELSLFYNCVGDWLLRLKLSSRRLNSLYRIVNFSSFIFVTLHEMSWECVVMASILTKIVKNLLRKIRLQRNLF